MKSTELREITDDELVEHIRNQRRELFGLRFQHATGELENNAGLKTTKRDLARALTIAHERGIDTDK
jgi:large subunit ribosomal protein L29